MKIEILLEQLEYDLNINTDRLSYLNILMKTNNNISDISQYNYFKLKYEEQNKYIQSLIKFINEELSKI